MATLECSVAWRLEVNVGDRMWAPRDVQKCGDDVCAMVHPYDCNLIKYALICPGEECPKSTARPSLANAP
eukprot:843831-Pyramimonas_sp.AAC.1